ncbi:BRISC complex subunit FAM175B-like [Venturia canescens]|uniref:BRISC complex subunit FAM175B-like n=1 Tax=Venturia canescens TaxID=32260 RepID=UPI001C9CDFB2|nr:BRISC complex subunit FAM175B-like [Venturia canescens]
MAESDVFATISGAALSLLFYENACSLGDQMGFLLGDMMMFVTKNVTDSERQVESVKRQIEITGVLACSGANQLFNESGKLHKDLLKAFVHYHSKKIVGWFRFRHNNRPVPTFRDKILHKELAQYFHECSPQLSQEYFAACIVNCTNSEKSGIHKFRHVLLRYKDGIYCPVPLRINSLGDNAARLEGSDYIPIPVTRISKEPDVITRLIRSMKLDFTNKNGSQMVTAIQKAAESHVKSLIPIVCESDREIKEMENSVQELRLKIISRVTAQKKCTPDNQRVIEVDNRESPLRMEGGDSSMEMEIKEEKPSTRTRSVHNEKESLHSKNRGIPRSNKAIRNETHSPKDSVQKSPSAYTNIQASRRSTSDEDIFNSTD